MSLVRIFEVAGSGMGAQSVRLNTVASNLANVDSVSSSEHKTYRARSAVFQKMLLEQQDIFNPAHNQAIGVQVGGIVESKAPLQKEHNPTHPQADQDGYIYKTNVNPMTEMANMISSSRSFQANAEVLESAKAMIQRTLTLGQ